MAHTNLTDVWGLRLHVAKDSEVIKGPDGEELVVTKGQGVGNGRDLYLVKSDYEALKAAIPEGRP